MKRRLKNAGEFEGQSKAKGDTYIRRALICYTGSFRTMDMEEDDEDLIVTKEELERVAQTYNAKIAKAKSINNGLLLDKYLAPLQLDHEESAKVTVGRVMGNCSIEDYTLLTGEVVDGLYADVKVLGEDNIEKCEDGRWTNLSVGCDFETGILSELTITPFAAAEEASFLRGKNKGVRLMNIKEKCMDYMTKHKGMSKEEAEKKYDKMDTDYAEKMSKEYDDKMKKMEDEEKNDSQMSADEDAQAKKLAEKAMGYMKKMMDEGKKEDKMSEGEDDNKEEMSNAEDLPESKLSNAEDLPESKLSNAEDLPESKLAGEENDDSKMSEGEIHVDINSHKEEEGGEEMSAEEEDDSKMSSEVDDTRKKDEMKEGEPTKEEIDEANNMKKKMSASHKSSFAKLKKQSQDNSKKVKMSLVRARIGNRLSALKAEAKITPAEIKKIDLNELASKDEATINDILKCYEAREPVVHTGIIGTHKALDLSQLSAEIKKVKLSEMENDSKKNMSFTSQAISNTQKLSGGKPVDKTPISAIDPANIDKVGENIANLLETGKIEEVKTAINSTLSDIKSLSMGSTAEVKMSSTRVDDIEKEFTELQKTNEKLIALLDELVGQ